MSLPLCLDQFSILVKDCVFFCYVNNNVQELPSDNAIVQNITDSVGHYPTTIGDPAQIFQQNTEDTQVLFQSSEDVLLKRLIRIYMDQGFFECIDTAADLHNNSNESKFITLPAFYFRKTLHRLQNMYYIIRPHMNEISKNYMLYYSTRDWLNSAIRYISWHPMCERLAIATVDDVIRVSSSRNDFTSILKGRNQKNISCLCWRPYAAFDIAVGTSIGIVLWKIDPNSIVSRPSIGNATILRQSDIGSLSWNTLGTLLISASSLSGYIAVWNCEQGINERVWCNRIGVNLLTWALNTHYVFSSGIDSTYKVWDTSDWSMSKWQLRKGIIQSACWSPCGNHLLFATTEDPCIYTINMNLALGPTKSSTPLMGPACLLDTTRVSTQFGEACGGLIQNIKISPNGSTLSIMFKFTNILAVCKIIITNTTVKVLPCFLFKGMPNEQPSCMDFQNDCKQGSLLTVAWSSARIQHVPIIQ